ncbi:MAG: cytochrome c [Acidobacteria bacterium]|nr:cytochrome c [Acidobacteriota bacterium]
MRTAFTLATLLGLSIMAGVTGQVAVSARQTAAPATAPAQGSRTQWDGVYTDVQAQRGDELYVKRCGTCHGTKLEGTDEAPPLTGAAFDGNWDALKMGELSERIRTTMPVEDPGSLTRAQTADVLAYVLRRAGAPAGQANLPTNVDQLNAITYLSKKPATN